MRKIALAVAPVLLVAATAVPAFADSQPSNGVGSTGRNDAGFGGGPHCHINTTASAHNPVFDNIVVYPSHQAHVASGLGEGPFAADPNCDGDVGN
jgi:hypothetical protein